MSAATPTATPRRVGGASGANLAPLLAVVASAFSVYGVPLSVGGLKQAAKAAIAKDPIDAISVTVLGGSYLFYLAEKGQNPKVESYFDALVFISTCLSVGYSDIFARTAAGKAIATAVMTFGPALTASVLDEPAAKPQLDEDQLAIQRAILGKLDAILEELKGQRG